MSVLIITEANKEKIAELIKYADENPFNMDYMKRLMKGIESPAGDDENYVCYLDFAYRVVFTIEQHPVGWCRHLSISVAVEGKYPSVQAVIMIGNEFGVTCSYNETDDAFIVPQGGAWVEEETESINIVQLIASRSLH